MYLLKRQLQQVLKDRSNSGKAILLIGPRQTGKTTLLRMMLEDFKPYLFLDGDNPQVRKELTNVNTEKLKQIIGNHKTVFIDEAQRIGNIGLTLKLITDQISHVKLFVSGSSAFELNEKINEPLTGRKWEYHLFPISWKELNDHIGYLDSKQQLEQRLVFGMYPDVIIHPGDEINILQQLTSSYLYKDILSLAGLRKPEIVEKLLKALAFQVGSQVSYNELSNHIKADKNTVSTYLDILEKAFVVFRLQPFSRNLRNEISTSRKIYFYDNGVRNSLIGNFSPIEFRQDKGALWENFLMAERKKQNHYTERYCLTYFWRTRQKQEIDYIEEADGKISAFEFKFNPSKKVKLSKTFANAYPDASFEVIDSENFTSFVMPETG